MGVQKMSAPAGVSGVVHAGGATYNIASDGTATVDNSLVSTLLNAGWSIFLATVKQAFFKAPIAAELISIKAAATPVNGAATIAAQPDYARKLQVRIVIGTTTTTAITAGTLTLVGVDQDGNAITEVVSLVQNASATVKTQWAYAKLTIATVAGYTASGSGTGNTLGIGVAADLGVVTNLGEVNLTCVKATKIVSTFTGSGSAVTTVSVVPSDDVAATTTVDTVARTIAPTTAPGSTGTTSTDFMFTYNFGQAL